MLAADKHLLSGFPHREGEMRASGGALSLVCVLYTTPSLHPSCGLQVLSMTILSELCVREGWQQTSQLLPLCQASCDVPVGEPHYGIVLPTYSHVQKGRAEK